jgi:CHAD domain-containing protein
VPDAAATRIRVPLDLRLAEVLARAGLSVTSATAGERRLDLLDTGDRRLAAAGAELSYSHRGGWRWRRDPLGHPKLRAREWGAAAETPRARIDEWSRAYRRGRPLGVRAHVRVRSRSHRVADDQERELLRLTDQRIDVRTPTGWTQRVRRIEVHPAVDGDGGGRALGVLDDVALPDGATLALLRPDLVRAPRLRLPDGSSTAARDLMARSMTLSLIQWLTFDCELSGSESPEALRKLRVALRRLRSDLQTFAPLLERRWSTSLRAELGDLGSLLGSVRDAEVRVGRLGDLVGRLSDGDRGLAMPLLDIAGMQLGSARAQLMDVLNREGYAQLVDRVVDAVTDPRWIETDDAPAMRRLARRPWRRLRAYVAGLGETPTSAELHRVRILAKRARYAADASVPAAGDAAAASATRLAALQTVLGEHHDATVTREWLQQQATAATDVAFAAGELAGIELDRARHAAESWRAAWTDASRKQDWRWLAS